MSVMDAVQCDGAIDVRVAVVDVVTDQRDLRVAQRHDQRIVVRREQLDQQVRRADWKRDLQLEMNLASNHHRRSVVVVVAVLL